MMENILISIVLPVHNGARYLACSIESCLAQTHANWELIIVDDASDDDTLEIVNRYVNIDRRIHLIKHATNRKLPAALNSGFAQASGKYFTWTSDDNLYKSEAISEMLSCLESNPDIHVVYADMTLIDEAGRAIRRNRAYPPQALGFRSNVVGGCFLFWRDVYDSVGGYAEDLFLVEDYFFWLCAAEKFNFAHLQKELYLYRIHESSLSEQKPDRRSLIGLSALPRALSVVKTNRVLRAGIYMNLASDYLQNGRKNEARKSLVKAFTNRPIEFIRYSSKNTIFAILVGKNI